MLKKSLEQKRYPNHNVWTKEVILRSRREWLGQRQSLKQKGYSEDRKVVLKQRVEKRGQVEAKSETEWLH